MATTPLELSGLQKRQLRDALMDAFPTWGEMRDLTLFQLELPLATIAGENSGIKNVAFELIEWASGRGLLADLIVAARNERPKHRLVNGLADLLGLTSAPAVGLEKFVNDNVLLLDIATWREGQSRAEWRVCRIDRSGNGRGTGFLVGPDLVLTNYHVVESLLKNPGDLSGWRARFDNKVTPDGKDLIAGRAVAFAANWDVDHAEYSPFDLLPDPKGGDPVAEHLDYALIRLAEPVGDQPVGASDQADPRGWVSLSATTIDLTAKRMVAIVQHPSGGPMKLALGMSEKMILNAAGNRVRHGVPTLPGSSGSPMFDQDWKLIALHHAGDPSTVKPEYNEGIPIALIAARPNVQAALPGA